MLTKDDLLTLDVFSHINNVCKKFIFFIKKQPPTSQQEVIYFTEQVLFCDRLYILGNLFRIFHSHCMNVPVHHLI